MQHFRTWVCAHRKFQITEAVADRPDPRFDYGALTYEMRIHAMGEEVERSGSDFANRRNR